MRNLIQITVLRVKLLNNNKRCIFQHKNNSHSTLRIPNPEEFQNALSEQAEHTRTRRYSFSSHMTFNKRIPFSKHMFSVFFGIGTSLARMVPKICPWKSIKYCSVFAKSNWLQETVYSINIGNHMNTSAFRDL